MASLVRFDTRKICVSTAMVACPNAVFKMTFAVLRPTPGRASKSLRFSGSEPACFESKSAQVLMMFLALVL